MITGLSLQEFRSKISDVARSNRFEVEITPPDSFKSYNDNQYQLLSWTAETAQIPKRDVGEITIKYHGMELKLPGDYGKENLTIGFINTYGWEGRNFFESWMEYIQKVNFGNFRAPAFSVIDTSQLVVRALGRMGDELSRYTFYNVFPTSISNIDLNMGSEDVQKFTVTFAFSHYF